MPKMVQSAGPHLLVVAVAAAMLTVGCGKGNLLESSTGPSSTFSSSALLNDVGGDSAATASRAGEADALAKGGNGQGNSGDKKPADNDDDQKRSHESKVVGFVSARDGDTLTVNGIPVVPGTNAIIRHGNRTLTTGDIEVGDHVQARGAMDGDKLVATEIKVEDTGSDNDDEDGEDDE